MKNQQTFICALISTTIEDCRKKKSVLTRRSSEAAGPLCIPGTKVCATKKEQESINARATHPPMGAVWPRAPTLAGRAPQRCTRHSRYPQRTCSLNGAAPREPCTTESLPKHTHRQTLYCKESSASVRCNTDKGHRMNARRASGR